jgi:hypothetical protein
MPDPNRKRLLLSIEALILGGPTSLIIVFYSPLILAGSLYTLVQGNPLASIGTLACSWALFHFWKLARLTILEEHYDFGIGFAFALIGAAVGAYIIGVGLPDWFATALVGLPFLGMVHFSYEQRILRKKRGLVQ